MGPLRWLALRLGAVDHPQPDSHKAQREAVPYLGGVAILAGTAAGLMVNENRSIGLLALVGVVAGVGLVDDILRASVAAKLVSECALAVAAMAFGFTWHLTDSPLINYGLTLFWIVGVTNAFNLLDNMDGLTSTIGATALLGLAVINAPATPLAGAVGGALVGFLFINRPPARMYMGDSGSLMVGFTIALATITAANTLRGLHSVVLLACPAALALFDTSLVIVSRLLKGRPIQLGGRDHFSHRLQLLGWARWQILWGAFGATCCSLLIAALADTYPRAMAWLAVPIGVAFVGAWLRLLRVDPYAAVSSRPEVISA